MAHPPLPAASAAVGATAADGWSPAPAGSASVASPEGLGRSPATVLFKNRPPPGGDAGMDTATVPAVRPSPRHRRRLVQVHQRRVGRAIASARAGFAAVDLSSGPGTGPVERGRGHRDGGGGRAPRPPARSAAGPGGGPSTRRSVPDLHRRQPVGQVQRILPDAADGIGCHGDPLGGVPCRGPGRPSTARPLAGTGAVPGIRALIPRRRRFRGRRWGRGRASWISLNRSTSAR